MAYPVSDTWNQSNWDRSIVVLKALAGEDALDVISKQNFHECTVSVRKEFDLQNYRLKPSSYLVLDDWIPRHPDVHKRWKEDAAKFFESGHVSAFINDIEDDPHLKLALTQLRDAVEAAEFDPSSNITTTHFSPQHVVSFGTAHGHDLVEVVNTLQPSHLTIVVNDWHEWASSFGYVDWLEIWNDYCADPLKTIAAIKTSDLISLQNYLVANFLPTLDHALLLKPHSSEALDKFFAGISDGWINRTVYYTGFVMDEYNMIYNSWKSLLTNPRIYQAPALPLKSGTFLVCGSGPSLDQSIEHIKKIQDDVVVVACASNYGTLRSAGINVDYLCLLERGEFMVNEYQEVIQQYGSGGTKLIASVTTPWKLFNFFDDVICYFRSALTPVSLFATMPSQVLTNEGPQTVNTGVALAYSLNADTILLVGCDLGVKSLEKQRASNAIGESPRTFELEVKGNKTDIAYTNSMLLDGAKVLENIHKAYLDRTVTQLNASDGINLEGWDSVDLNNISFVTKSSLEDDDPQDNSNKDTAKNIAFKRDKHVVTQWSNSLPQYDKQRFKQLWKTSRVRHHTNLKIQSVIDILNTPNPWDPIMVTQIHSEMRIDQGQRFSQIGSRIIRGQVIKMLLAIQRQSIVMAEFPDKKDKFLSLAKSIMVEQLNILRNQIFQLYDLIDSDLD